MGLIVLFDNDAHDNGQFHMDFRFWGHFGVDNGNIAQNYGTFTRWYGKIPGYKPKAVTPPPRNENQNHRVRSKLHAEPQSDLRKSVAAFLTTWYVRRDLDNVIEFVARDNFTSFAKLEGALNESTVGWTDIFREAFASRDSKAHPKALSDAVGYYEPGRPPGTTPFKYLNPRSDPFAVVDTRSVPNGVFFTSKFLNHLRDKYGSTNDAEGGGRLALVIYVVKNNVGLMPETAITYWIQEGDKWKIAAYRGWD